MKIDLSGLLNKSLDVGKWDGEHPYVIVHR